MRIMVVGAGLVGLATAYSLSRIDGVQVQVVDAGPRAGGGASRGNAGWVCPTQVAPLAAPGLVRTLTREALSSSSALYLRPGGVLPLAPFLLRLTTGATSATYRRRVTALRVLADRAWPALDEAVSAGLAVQLHRTGILSVFADEAGGRHMLDVLAPARAAGAQVPTELTTELPETCLTDRARYGYVLAGDGFVDPGELVEALAAAVLSAGGEIAFGTAPEALRREGDRWSLSCGGQRRTADAVVLAAGAATAALARRAGHRIRVVPGKGYSFTVPMRTPPRMPVHLEQAHVVLTPLRGGVRVAGTMELGDRGNRLDQRRIQAIIDAATPWVQGVDWDHRTDVWVGERPLTADGLPVIGQLEPGLFVGTGHGMYGVTLALPTGERLARMVVGDDPAVDLSAFSPRRAAVRLV